MPGSRKSESDPRKHPRGRDYEREGKFQHEDKPGRGASGTTTRSTDATPGTRLSPRKPGTRRGESTRAKSLSPSKKRSSRAGSRNRRVSA
jgi:hypothetical protein